MKYPILSLLTILFFACADKKEETIQEQKIQNIFFQSLLDSAQLKGAILVYDFQKNTYHSNNFEWANTGHLPASTYKIPNSIIALETEIIENDSTLIKWDGQTRKHKNWNQDLEFRKALLYSCVPCYQEIARKVGVKTMNQYLAKFNYGYMEVDSTNIDEFWLVGKSRINQFQQIDFLKRFHQTQLPISKRTHQTIKRMLLLDKTSDYALSAKTGWSNENGHNGWFVGYLERGKDVYFFATNIEPKEGFDMKLFPSIRKQITTNALKKLNLLK